MAGNALQAVLDKAARETAPEAAPASAARTTAPRKRAVPSAVPEAAPKFSRPSRENRKFIGGHFSPDVGKQLRLIAVEDGTTIQELLEEALDLLFVKKGRQTIRDLPAR